MWPYLLSEGVWKFASMLERRSASHQNAKQDTSYTVSMAAFGLQCLDRASNHYTPSGTCDATEGEKLFRGVKTGEAVDSRYVLNDVPKTRSPDAPLPILTLRPTHFKCLTVGRPLPERPLSCWACSALWEFSRWQVTARRCCQSPPLLTGEPSLLGSLLLQLNCTYLDILRWNKRGRDRLRVALLFWVEPLGHKRILVMR